MQEFFQRARTARNADGKQTEFTLRSGNYSPEELMLFKNLRIYKLLARALILDDYSDAEFVKLLEEVNPTWVLIRNWGRKYSLDDLGHLLKFEVMLVYASSLDFDASNEKEFVRLICEKYNACPISSGVRNANKLSACSQQLLAEAGLNFFLV